MAEELTCPKCAAPFGSRVPLSGNAYACMRCDVYVSGDKRGQTAGLRGGGSLSSGVFLYSAATGKPERPAEPRTGLNVDETWTGAEVDGTAPTLDRIGRYTLVAELGRGGAGVVYRVHDPDLSRDVALKLLLGGHHAGHAQVERFLREARSAARLDHPDLLRVHDIGRHEDQVYFTMDLVGGPSLRDVLDEIGRFPVGEAARIVGRCARAIQQAHHAGLVHRDIKPANILLEVDGSPKVTDFGLAYEVERGGARLTKTGQVLGTPAYMAPEQARGETATGVASDVYSLGAVLYELLCGKAPYEGDSGIQVLSRLLSGPPIPIREVAPWVSPELGAIVGRAMALIPADRYPTAAALAEDLEAFQAGRAVKARPPSLIKRFVGRARARRGLLAALLAVIASAGAAMWWQEHQNVEVEADREAAAQTRLVAVEGKIETSVATGHFSDAESALAGYLSVPEHAGTRAFSQAWLNHAPRRAAANDVDGELQAWAEGYLAAVDDEQEADALVGLARAWKAREKLAEWVTVLDTLRRNAPHASGRADVQKLLIDAAAQTQDLGGAAALARTAGDDRAPLLEKLSGITLTEWSALAGAGQGEKLILGTADRELVAIATGASGLHEERRYSLPEAAPLPGAMVPFGDDLAIGTGNNSEGAGMWLHLGADVEPLQTWLIPHPTAGVVHGGKRYLASTWPKRGLWRVDPSWHGEVSLEPADRVRDQSDSNVNGLVAGDFDGDGTEEIAISSGPWRAFDLRVARPGPEGLATLDRKQIGSAGAVGVVHTPERTCEDGSRCGGMLLVTAVSHSAPSADLFGAANPYRNPPGLYVFRWQDGKLTQTDQTPLPMPVPADVERAFDALSVGDLDGDGQEDVVVRDYDRGGTIFFRQMNGHFLPVEVRGLVPLALVQADADPERELVVLKADNVIVLGAGTARLPATVTAAPPEGAPPASDSVVLELSRRAEELVSMGLPRAAAEAYERASLLTTGHAAALAAARAGKLYASLGEHALALPLFKAAEGSEGDVVRCLLDLGRFDEAKAELSHANAPGALVAEVNTAAEQSTYILDVSKPIGSVWRVLSPAAVHATSDGLSLRTFGPSQVIAEMPLVGGQSGFSVSLGIDVVRAEWAGGMEIGIFPRESGSSAAGVFIGAGGGGGLQRLTINAGGTRAPGVGEIWRMLQTDTERSYQLRMAWRPKRSLSTLRDASGKLLGWAAGTPDSTLPSSRWVLRISAANQAATGALTEVVVRSLSLTGLAPDPDAPAAANAPAPDSANPWLSTGTKEQPGEINPDVALWARTPDGAQALAQRWPSEWPTIFEATWGAAVFSAFPDATADHALTTDLEQALRASFLDPAQEASRLRLLAARAAAWRRLGAPDNAKADLQQVILAPSALPKSVANAHFELAAIAAAGNDHATAMLELREAMHNVAQPWRKLDLMRNNAAFSTWSETDWREVETLAEAP